VINQHSLTELGLLVPLPSWTYHILSN